MTFDDYMESVIKGDVTITGWGIGLTPILIAPQCDKRVSILVSNVGAGDVFLSVRNQNFVLAVIRLSIADPPLHWNLITHGPFVTEAWYGMSVAPAQSLSVTEAFRM